MEKKAVTTKSIKTYKNEKIQEARDKEKGYKPYQEVYKRTSYDNDVVDQHKFESWGCLGLTFILIIIIMMLNIMTSCSTNRYYHDPTHPKNAAKVKKLQQYDLQRFRN